jgi:hypothetical protein
MEQIPIPRPVNLPGIPRQVNLAIQFAFQQYCRVGENGEWLKLSPEKRKQFKKRVENHILLGTALEMPRVWKEVIKLESQRINRTRHNSISEFIRAINSGLYDEAMWGELTPKARATKHAQIIHTMRQLAKDIKYYDLDQREEVMNLFNDNEGANVEPGDGTLNRGQLGPFTSYRDIYEKQTGVQISSLLQKHADKLEHQKRYLAPLTSKTKGERRLLHFIRTLAIHNKEQYGQHHGALISRVASVYFPDAETEPEKIRASIHALNL